MSKVLVYGLAITGSSVIRALSKRGYTPICLDDRETTENRSTAENLGVEVEFAPTVERITALVAECDFVVPAPGLRESHPVRVQASAQGKNCVSELDLAYEWESARTGGARPMIAITGTDGKTTTVALTAQIVRESGKTVVEAGNTDIPLVEAIDREDVDVFVVECSSFRLATIKKFRATAATWLNFSPDHLDWHDSLSSYRAAKEQIWRNNLASDVVVYPANTPEIANFAASVMGKKVGFGLGGEYSVQSGALMARDETIVSVAEMWRALPHDIDNSLAACALAIESGLASIADAEVALGTFTPPHHRIEFIADDHGVAWYDDSKATTPHAARAAIRSFASVILIAGGRNKDLDLGELAHEADHIKAVVATGEGIEDLTAAFAGIRQVHPAHSMIDAVRTARALASNGDTVLLSPACTSFDWYRNYNERGDDFVRCVREVLSQQSKEKQK